MKRIDTLSGLRAFAAIWVVLFHINASGSPAHGRLGTVVEHGEIGVDLFFVLSGFVLSLVYAERLPESFAWGWYRRFLSRRFAKIYPLHLLTFFAMAAMLLGAERLVPGFTAWGENTWWSAWCNVLLLHAFGLTQTLSWNAPSWSVSAEWFAYAAMFAPMVFLLRRVKTVYVAAIAVVLIAAATWFGRFLGSPWTGLTHHGVVRIAPEFFCGYLLHRLLRGKTGRMPNDWWTVAGFAMLLAGCFLPEAAAAQIGWWRVAAAMVLLAGLYQAGPLSKTVFGNRWAVALGDASYSIYLTQNFGIFAAGQILRKLHVPWTGAMLVAASVAETAAVAACGVAIFRGVEEPLRQMVLRKLSGGAKNPEAAGGGRTKGMEADTQVSSTIG